MQSDISDIALLSESPRRSDYGKRNSLIRTSSYEEVPTSMSSDLQGECAHRLLVSFNRCLHTNTNTLLEQSTLKETTSQ